jgi:hypothetical protein
MHVQQVTVNLQAIWLTPIILATLEAEIRKILVQGQLRQKVSETPSQQIRRALWHMHGIPARQEA